MIVRDLLIKLGFQANLSGANAASAAIGMIGSQLAMLGLAKANKEMDDAVKSSLEFGRSMANVAALMPGNDAQVAGLAQAAKDLGREFGVMPAEVSAAMYNVIGNLGYTADSVDQVRQSILLAKSGAATTSEAFGLLSAVTRAYGDTSAGAMKHTADLASASVRLGALTLPELAASIQMVTPAASALGVKLEELFAVQASLSGVAGSASEVYTQMQSAMTSLLKKTPAMERAFKKAFRHEGIKTTKAAIGKYGLQGTLEKLIKTTDGTEESLTELFGRIEGVRFGMSVSGNMAADYKTKLAQMGKVSGEVDRAVRAQTTGMGANAYAMDKAKSAAEAQRIELGDKLAPTWVRFQVLSGVAAKAFGDSIIPMFDDGTSGAERMREATQDILTLFEVLAKVVGGLKIGFDTLATVIAQVADDLVAIATGVEMLARMNPTGALAIGKEWTKSSAERWGKYADRTNDTAAKIMGEESDRQRVDRFARQSREAAKKREEWAGGMAAFASSAQSFFSSPARGRRGVAQLVNNIGGMAVNVTVPHGTEASSAARIGDLSARAFLAQISEGIQRAFPVQAVDNGSDW